MKHPLPLLLVVLFLLPSLACSLVIPANENITRGSGNIETQNVEVSDFDRVSLEISGDVYIQQGQMESLTIEADDNILPLLETEIRGNELVLSARPNQRIDPSRKIVYRITAKDLSGITLNGSGNFYVSPLRSDSMRLTINGSGDMEIDDLETGRLSLALNGSGNIAIDKLDATSADASLNGSGDIRLAGQVPTQEISFNGSGNYQAGDLQSGSVEIDVPGSADITVWVTDTLKTHIDGSGSVSYYGRPTVDQTGNGSGKLISLGEK